ncbi:MAG: tyrosine recombinase [Ardenticatenales bacterium]|nr:tyrosine recombinase [Ardenticatenales bacterium]
MRQRIDDYLAHLSQEEDYSENTIAAYRNDLAQFCQWLEEHGRMGCGWENITLEDITNYLFHLREREYAPSTIARKMAALKSYFHHLVEQEEILESPTNDVDGPKVKKYAPQALSRDGVARLMAEAARLKNSKGLRDRAMLELLYATGMRVSELVNLEVNHLNMEQWTLRCGSGQNERVVPVAVRAVGALNDYLEKGRSQLVSGDEQPILFLNMRGNQLTRQGLWLIIKNYVERAGIKAEVTPHTLRHSFAIHRLNDGSELSEVQGLLGHANISTTQVYTHGREERE